MSTHGRFIIALLLLSAFAAGSHYLHSLLSIGAAYKAKVLCSGVFVSHRPANSVLNIDLAADDLASLRHIDAKIDYGRSAVAAGFPGLIEHTARYRPGLGCTLAAPDTELLPIAVGTGPAQGTESLVSPLGKHDALESILDWAFAEPDPEHPRRTRAVVILHGGRIVAERYAPGFDAETPLAGWSMAKGAMNALAGLLVGEGRLALSTPVDAPEWRTSGDPRQAITLGHLLNMESGLEFSEDYGNPLQDVTYMLLREPDAAGYSARKPLQVPPGTRWHYASGTTNILSRLIRKTVGEAEYPGFPRRALFEPLGMDSAVLEPDASGTFVGSSFMYATARDWAKLGQLYLQDGIWNGRRLLPDGWVRYTVTPAARAPNREYGAHFWLRLDDAAAYPLPPDAFHASGFEGQQLSIIPSRRLVIVRLGLTRHAEAWRRGEFVSRVVEAVDGDTGRKTAVPRPGGLNGPVRLSKSLENC